MLCISNTGTVLRLSHSLPLNQLYSHYKGDSSPEESTETGRSEYRSTFLSNLKTGASGLGLKVKEVTEKVGEKEKGFILLFL